VGEKSRPHHPVGANMSKELEDSLYKKKKKILKPTIDKPNKKK